MWAILVITGKVRLKEWGRVESDPLRYGDVTEHGTLGNKMDKQPIGIVPKLRNQETSRTENNHPNKR